MPQFQVLDGKKYPLQVTDAKGKLLQYHRYEHRATLGWNTREFMVFADHLMLEMHIEEVIGGHLEVIDDDPLFEALKKYSYKNGFMEVAPPPLRSLS